MSKPWYSKGLQFGCTRSGNCCRNHGEYSRVYVSEEEVVAIAGHLGLSTEEFLETHCDEEDGWTVLTLGEEQCRFLGEESTCEIYPVRPVQCSTWPFWTENLDRGAWEGPVRKICPGLDKGPLIPLEEIEESAKRADAWREDD